jgi:uncharacterized protein
MQKPQPLPNADSRPYWDACKLEQLIYQCCEDCGQAQFYPRARCVHCLSQKLQWRRSGCLGTVYAFTEIYVGQPAFNEQAPYLVALIELDEGFRIMSNVIGGSSEVRIGCRGRIVCESRGEIKLPQFVVEPVTKLPSPSSS